MTETSLTCHSNLQYCGAHHVNANLMVFTISPFSGIVVMVVEDLLLNVCKKKDNKTHIYLKFTFTVFNLLSNKIKIILKYSNLWFVIHHDQKESTVREEHTAHKAWISYTSYKICCFPSIHSSITFLITKVALQLLELELQQLHLLMTSLLFWKHISESKY